MPARPFAFVSGPSRKALAKHLFFSSSSAFLGPDLERPKLYQSFFAMGNKKRKKFRKKRDLHAPNF